VPLPRRLSSGNHVGRLGYVCEYFAVIGVAGCFSNSNMISTAGCVVADANLSAETLRALADVRCLVGFPSPRMHLLIILVCLSTGC
jgi:hypothetical protein